MNPCEGVAISWEATNPFFKKLYAVSAEKVTHVSDTTRLRIMRTLDDAYENGLSIRDTAKELEALKSINAARARMIARTEMAALTNGATVAAAQVISEATGDTYMKRWLTAEGAEHPRHEDYDGLDGQEVEIGELFDVGGEKLEFPGDPDGPSDEVINCRCTVVLVERDGSAGEELSASAYVADDVRSEIAAVAEKHEPEGGYGETAWNAETETVFWVAADWTTNEELDAAEDDFLAIEGVAALEREAEAALPSGPEWEQVWPQEAVTAAAPSPEAAMIALYPTPEQAARIAQAGGEEAAILHVTLTFLGEITPEQGAEIDRVVGLIAATYPVLQGMIGGVASFGEGDLGYPSLALPNVPGLAELHMAVCYGLWEAGIPWMQNHGWVPHMTIAYTPELSPPASDLIGEPLTFQWLTYARGDVRSDHMLTG